MNTSTFAFNRALKTRLALAVMAREDLIPVKKLYDTGEVYLITQDNASDIHKVLRVFKVGFSGDEQDKRHILPEARALEVLAGNEVLQTPALYVMGSNKINGYHALHIVKEFVPGTTMDVSTEPIPITAYDALEAAIEEAHKQGVANLDIDACNILEREDSTLQFFEYSGVRFRDQQRGLTPNARLWTGKQEFARYQRKDWIDFEKTKERLLEKGKLA